MTEPTQEDLALDLSTKLDETNTAIAYLSSRGEQIPEEAYEIRAILRRALLTEYKLKKIQEVLS